MLAVGDAAFQQKCFDEFARIRDAGRTVLLVTHDMGAVQRFCDRAMLLEHGAIVEIGDPERVGQPLPRAELLPRRRATARRASEAGRRASASATGAPRSSRRGSRTSAGARADVLPTGEPLRVLLRACASASDVDDPLFGVDLLNERPRRRARRPPTCWPRRDAGASRPARRSIVRASRFDNVLAAGPLLRDARRSRSRGAGVRRGSTGASGFASVVVAGTRATDAVVDLPYEFDLERGASRAMSPLSAVAAALGQPIKGPSRARRRTRAASGT